MKSIDVVVSDLCEEIDRLRIERDQWKSKYEDCDRRLREFIDLSIANGEATHNNWVLYALKFPPQKKYKIAWRNGRGHLQLGSKVFDSWTECQVECEKCDGVFPGVRHWPEEI
jgi:hypothetical protein